MIGPGTTLPPASKPAYEPRFRLAKCAEMWHVAQWAANIGAISLLKDRPLRFTGAEAAFSCCFTQASKSFCAITYSLAVIVEWPIPQNSEQINGYSPVRMVLKCISVG